MKHKKLMVSVMVTATLAGCSKPATDDSKAAKVWPKLDIAVKKDDAVEARVAKLLSGMTVEQKVAQMIQPEIRDISVEDMRKYGFGSYLNGGGAFPNDNKHATPADWINLAESLYQASIDDSLDGSTIPTMWGTDAVHGHNNVIGATLFPHNIGLGAADNPELIEKIATATAKEVMATGIDWVFAPTVAVVRDDRWGRTYEGYSEDPRIVHDYAAAIVNGLQGHADGDFLGDKRVISTVKHFLGDGGTIKGDDQGNNTASEEDLFKIHAQGYVGGLTVGAQSVMASFNSWHGEKLHGHQYLLTEVLKKRMGFDGFVVGDWNGHGQVAECDNQSCPQAINAGLDIFMVPGGDWKGLFENTVEQAKDGTIPMSRIDDAVTRILRVKVRAGLFEKPSPAKRPLAGKTELIGHPDHRAIARQAVRESLVLLKNNHGILPIKPGQKVLVAGDGADNIGKQAGGWTITWQGTGNNNNDFPGGSSIYAGIRDAVTASGGTVMLDAEGNYNEKPDVAVVVFGENPYAEGIGDLDNLEYQRGAPTDLQLLQKLKADGIKVVSVFLSGRPMWVNPHINASEAFVAAWLPGSEGQGIADILVAKPDGSINHNFSGKLSFSWPRDPNQTVNYGDKDYDPLFAYGYGLTYQDQTNVAQLSEEVSVQDQARQDLPLLVGTVKAPWSLFVATSDKQQQVTSSVIENDYLKMRTIDKVVQEDARQLTFNGKGEGRMFITQPFPEDLRSFSENQGVLTFDIKRESDITGGVHLGVDCKQDCEKPLDISQQLASLPEGEWQTVSVAMSCFEKLGVDFAKVYTPFALSATSELRLSIANIQLKQGDSGKSTGACQS